ncbi:MAG: Rmt family 16S rRNA (guanine(1405)-N(7))-methyltransferase [Anaerolineae bacterium]|jgi:16S rRNA (guanine(1405)-N(7))-methyltransferase
MAESTALDTVVSAVASSKKYRAVCPDTIHRIAVRELAAHGSVKAATKATKRRLHQAYGAFEHDFDEQAATQRLEAAYRKGSPSLIRSACAHVLGLHSSTRERLPILDRFYAAIFEVTGQPSSLLDVGCGLNPLSLPWMDLPSNARYVALDIDAGRVRFLNHYLSLAGSEPLARCQDALSYPPDDAADVALLLKMSPTLERQEPGATLHLMERLVAPYVVVSFAIKSLGGREKGMADHYQQQFRTWMNGRHWPVETLSFETELVFVVNKPCLGGLGSR